jgi:hypothetical protein
MGNGSDCQRLFSLCGVFLLQEIEITENKQCQGMLFPCCLNYLIKVTGVFSSGFCSVVTVVSLKRKES